MSEELITGDGSDGLEEFAADIGLNYPALIGGYGAIELSKTLGNRLGALAGPKRRFCSAIRRAGR